MLLLFSIYFLISLPLFPCQEDSSSRESKYDSFEHMSYESTGFCEAPQSSDSPICVPYKNFTFSHIWSENSAEYLKNLINSKIAENPNYNKKLAARLVKNIMKNSTSVELFAKEEINDGEWLSSFNYKDSLTVTAINYALFTDEFLALKKYKKAGLPSIFLPENDKIFEKFFNTIINLLLHLKNLGFSKIKEQILLLPENLEKFNFFKFTAYEIENLMKGDEIQGKFSKIHTYYQEGYKLFKESLVNSWPKELIKALFHYEEFPYEDFAYCLTIFYFKYNSYALPNIFHNSQHKQENKTINSTLFTTEFLNKTPVDEEFLSENKLLSLKKFKLFSPQKFEKDERLVIDYGRVGAADYIMTGDFKGGIDTLEDECFEIFFLNADSAERYKEPGKFIKNSIITVNFPLFL